MSRRKTTSISDVLRELTDLVERAHDIDEGRRQVTLDWIFEMRATWPYNTLVRRLDDLTGEPAE